MMSVRYISIDHSRAGGMSFSLRQRIGVTSADVTASLVHKSAFPNWRWPLISFLGVPESWIYGKSLRPAWSPAARRHRHNHWRNRRHCQWKLISSGLQEQATPSTTGGRPDAAFE